MAQVWLSTGKNEWEEKDGLLGEKKSCRKVQQQKKIISKAVDNQLFQKFIQDRMNLL